METGKPGSREGSLPSNPALTSCSQHPEFLPKNQKLKTNNCLKMRVYVNDEPLELVPGMTVRHALIKAGLFQKIEAGLKAYDEWGNELGLAGALAPDMKIWVK